MIVLSISAGWSQSGKNPFQLEESNTVDSVSIDKASDRNPFALDRPVEQADNPFVLSAPGKPQGVQGRAEVDRGSRIADRPSLNFQFFFFSGLLVFMTILFTVHRAMIVSLYKAFWNDNILKLLHRQRPVWKSSTLLWYAFFFLNIAVFLGQWIGHLSGEGLAWLTLKMTVFVLGAVLLKHLVISFIGGVFPLAKETSLYNFTIIVFAINLGLFLLPFNLLIAFGPTSIKPGIFYVASAVIALHFGYRSLRAMLQTSSLWSKNKFHFFLYLCAVEITPVLVLIKAVFG